MLRFSRVTAFATDVKVKIPVPKNTTLCNIFNQTGRAKYTPEESAIMWK
jgi:hypothetical protein